MNRYLLALLFVFMSSPCFSTDNEVKDLFGDYKNKVMNGAITDQALIDYLEEKKVNHNRVYEKFLITKSTDPEQEYPSYVAMVKNRADLFKYLLDNNARLSDRLFKNPINSGLSNYFEPDCLSGKFIPLVHRALNQKGVSTAKINEFFSHLYMTFMPGHFKAHVQVMKQLDDHESLHRELRGELVKVMQESTTLQQENLHAKGQHAQLDRRHTELAENFLKKEEELQRSAEALQMSKDKNKDKKNALQQLNTEKVRLVEEYDRTLEQIKRLQEQHAQLGIDYNTLQETLRERNNSLFQKDQALDTNRVSLERLNREKDDLAEQHRQLTEQERILREQHDLLTGQHAQLGLDHTGLQDTLRERDNTLLERQQALDANRVSLERLNREKDDLAEQHRQLTEQERILREQHDLLTGQHAQLGLRHTELAENFLKKEEALQRNIEAFQMSKDKNKDKKNALQQLNTEKTDLTEQYRQSVLAVKTLENNIALLEKQNTASEIQLRILQEKSLPQSSEVKETVMLVSSHEASAPWSIESSLGTSVYKTDSSSEETLVLSLENQKTDSLHLVTPQVIVEGNIAEQAMEARRTFSSQYSKKYAQLAAQQIKAEIAQTESMEQLKIEEEKANLSFEKNKRAETDRQLLEMQIESKRNRN